MHSTVLSCGASECAYNMPDGCHATSISVGSEHAACDTFSLSGVLEESAHPGVVSCGIPDCQFNSDKICKAAGITVATHERHADCTTVWRGFLF